VFFFRHCLSPFHPNLFLPSCILFHLPFPLCSPLSSSFLTSTFLAFPYLPPSYLYFPALSSAFLPFPPLSISFLLSSPLYSPRCLGGILLTLLSKFATCVADSVDGKGSTAEGVEMNDLYGGARISYIFNEVRKIHIHFPVVVGYCYLHIFIIKH
jgi:hypothetical protein